MSNTKHTPGPWKQVRIQSELRIVAPPNGRGRIIAEMGASWGHENACANAARIVACVNACEGINPEAVPEMLEALKQAVIELEGTRDRLAMAASNRIKVLIAKAEGK